MNKETIIEVEYESLDGNVDLSMLYKGLPLLYSNHGNKEYCIFMGLKDNGILVKFGRNEGVLLTSRKLLFAVDIIELSLRIEEPKIEDECCGRCDGVHDFCRSETNPEK